MKLEERSSSQAVLSQASSERGFMRGVQMFLVKAEEHMSVNDPVIFQAHQPTDIHHVSCQGWLAVLTTYFFLNSASLHHLIQKNMGLKAF